MCYRVTVSPPRQILPLDVALLPSHFDAPAAEKRWAESWEKQGIYHYDAARPREETFVVDTPPPTVSGSLHIGHVFSYTHTDVLVRFQRMRGKNIFYPLGWDDNGLPTERRVQNYFHVRVEVKQPYVENLKLQAAEPETVKKQPPRPVSRPNFIELCNQLTQEDEKVFKALFGRIGLSVDWNAEYATISAACRTLAQKSFLDLHAKGHIYTSDAPTMWDVDFQTAVAQAEVEDRPSAGHFHDLAFAVEHSADPIVVSTTRPELLPAVVGVAAHPDDPRYRHLFGKQAIVPLFHVSVPIFASTLVDPEKGTGILMVSTFGDATDVVWWREHKLALRQILGRDGRLQPVIYGSPGWESSKPEEANRLYATLQGKRVKQARKLIVEMLRGAGLQGEPRPVERAVKFFEKGDEPLEFITTSQWFVRLMDKKQSLLEMGSRIAWHPDFMGVRYRQWTEGLQFDWCISRQRYFGVPIPVWYPLDEKGHPNLSQPIVADKEQMPVDPTTDAPLGYQHSQRNQPGGFIGETDVFDTWFTSSLTPQIGSHWPDDLKRHGRLFPADIRPQSHEIIRTWAFYTIAKAMLHENSIPWKHVVISGWVLDPDRKKMSKSKGNVVTPMSLLDTYTSDGVRYWAASARLGTDTAFDENMLKIGRRLVTKLFNAAKYVLAQGGPVAPISHPLDRAFVAQLGQLVRSATDALEKFEYAEALSAIETFFWTIFTDTFMELAKGRARGQGGTADEQGSAVATLRLGLNVLLRLFAPVIPYITEEIWSWAFAAETQYLSIHRSPWPSAEEWKETGLPSNLRVLEMAQTAYRCVNKRKADLEASVGRPVKRVSVAVNAATRAVLETCLFDLKAATRSENWEWREDSNLAEGEVRVVDLELAVVEPKV